MASAAGKPVLGKKSLSAFATTNLDEMLREAGIGQLIIAGVATSGTVLSTTRWAVDTGYRVTVCADACADPEPGTADLPSSTASVTFVLPVALSAHSYPRPGM